MPTAEYPNLQKTFKSSRTSGARQRDTTPVCPACGGLECLCRPSFFAGQLLSEDDLNRLNNYVVAKNRLHNRHLVGWGVACGLEVSLDRCKPRGVVVGQGYAVSPCGNDIVVCKERYVDICELIARCRPSDEMCLSGEEPIRKLKDVPPERWILGICYSERPSRGVTPLLNATDPYQSRCGCGQHSTSNGHQTQSTRTGCGCGSPVTRGSDAAWRSPTRPTSPQCEPTLTCECYTFVVWQESSGAERRSNAAFRQIGSAIKSAVDYYSESSSGRHMEVELKALLTKTVAQLRETSCSALLPPCPDTSPNDCVPIATVTVTPESCTVEAVCSFDARRLLITIPNIEYWLSLFLGGVDPVDVLGTLMKKRCCTGSIQPVPPAPEDPQAMMPMPAPRPGLISRMVSDAATNPERTVTYETFVRGMAGETDDANQPLMSEFERNNATQFLLLHQVLMPALREISPADPAALATLVTGRTAQDFRVAELEKQVAALQQAVNALQNP